MNPEQLLEKAKAAIARGADPNAVNQRIAEATQGQFENMNALAQAVATNENGAAESPEQAALQRLNERGGSALGDFLRMAAQGASFGFADEIAGAGAAVIPGGKGYEEARDASRERVEDHRTLNPGSSMMAEVAGGVGVPFATGARVARGLTRQGAGVLGRMGAAGAGGATAGGAAGALTGVGEGETADERVRGGLLSGAMGAGAGGVLGAGAAGAGAAIGRGGRFMGEVFSPQGQGQREAGRALRDTFGEARIQPDEIAAGLEKLGPDAVVADLSPTLSRRARAARNQAPALDRVGGPVSKVAERADARGERLAKAMRQASGITESRRSATRAAEAAVEDVRANHYRPLEEAFPQVQGENVSAALQNPRVAKVAKRVIGDGPASSGAGEKIEAAVVRVNGQDFEGINHGAALDKARQAGVLPDDFDPWTPGVNTDLFKTSTGRIINRFEASRELGQTSAEGAIRQGPSFTEMQDILITLRDDASEAAAKGRPGEAQKAREALRVVEEAMEQDIPGFSDAQAAFHKASERVRALEDGYAFQGSNMTKSADQIRESLGELSPENRDAFRLGMIQRWEERLLSREGGGAAAGQVVNAGKEVRDQMRLLFGSEEGFQQFLRQKGLEETFGLTWNAVSGNSTTSMQASDMLQSAPRTKEAMWGRIWDALLDPGEARQVREEAVGEALMGNNVDELLKMLQGGTLRGLGVGVPGAAGGIGAGGGVAAGGLLR